MDQLEDTWAEDAFLRHMAILVNKSVACMVQPEEDMLLLEATMIVRNV